MCGIVALFELKTKPQALKTKVLDMAKSLRHRGPDWSGIFLDDKAILAHERLAIVDPQSGGQPIISADGKLVLAANGEIYNHKELRKELEDEYEFQTQSDCEVILALYRKYGAEFVDKLNGIYAFAIYDVAKGSYMIARDHMGIIPLYQGWDEQGQYYVASELKALEGVCNKIESFLPGQYKLDQSEPVRWYSRDWESFDAVKNNVSSQEELKDALEGAVKRQLMSDVPYGVLLSGGLDSSVVSAIAKEYASMRVESDGQQQAWYPQLHSFAIGLEGSPDLAAAQKVADHIGTVHHEVHDKEFMDVAMRLYSKSISNRMQQRSQYLLCHRSPVVHLQH